MGFHAEASYINSHGKYPEVLASSEDVDAFVDRLLAQPGTSNLAALYLVERLRP